MSKTNLNSDAAKEEPIKDDLQNRRPTVSCEVDPLGREILDSPECALTRVRTLAGTTFRLYGGAGAVRTQIVVDPPTRTELLIPTRVVLATAAAAATSYGLVDAAHVADEPMPD